MTRMLKAEAEKLLAPYFETFCKCVEEAWNDYPAEYSAKVRVIHTTRTKANIINDHMVYRAWKEFSERPGVRVIMQRGQVFVLIGKALIRFKKLGRDGRARNYPTKAATRFSENQLPLVGLPDHAIRLNAGYVTNRLQTQIKKILIACPRGLRDVDYVLDIWFQPDAGILALPEITPQPSETIVLPKVDTMEIAKNGASGESQDGDSR